MLFCADIGTAVLKGFTILFTISLLIDRVSSTNLTGTEFLGNVFSQHDNEKWIQIDNVILGKSAKFSYRKISTGNISRVLHRLVNDDKVFLVDYNQNTKIAYVRSGFNPFEKSDSQISNGFTAFLVKKKIEKLNIKFPLSTRTKTTSTSTKTTSTKTTSTENNSLSTYDYVSQSKGTFYVNNEKFVPVGFNAFWLGFGLEESTNGYPAHVCIEEMFIVAKKMAATVIRSHTLGSSSGSPNTLRPNGRTLKFNAWDTIDYSFAMAKKYNIRIIAPLLDNYFYINGNYGDYTKERGLSKNAFWTDQGCIADFKDYIGKWLNHVNKYTKIAIKNDPYLFMIETGNELGNIRSDVDSVPPKSWIQTVTSYIKSIDNKHIILDGSDESLGQSDNFRITTVDSFSRHFYSSDANAIDAMHDMASKSAAVGKPFIVGEYDSHVGENFLREMEKDPNIKGSLFWSMFPHADGIDGPYIRHEDGYSQYYPETSGDLLRLTNHMRRFRGLPEISSLQK